MPGPDENLERTDLLAAPRVLAGKYRLGELLGEGGMGAVYVAEHIGLGTKVAIKLLASIWTGKPEVVARFRREARAAAAVKHDNIVTVTDIDADEDGRPFIVMELLRGESVQALLLRQRILSPTVAAAIVGEALRGLAVAHEAKIIHRDLKPPNILLAQVGGSLRVKILDFGIAKVLEEGLHEITITLAGAMVGTLRYMAPEQLASDPTVDHRVDIYSLGVTLYSLTTGKLPFGGDTAEETTRLIREGIFPRPRELRPELPEALEQVILRAMSLRREDRFPDAAAFLDALGRAVPVVAQSYRLTIAGSSPGLAAEGQRPGVTDVPVPVISSSAPPENVTVAAGPQALQKAKRGANRRRLLAGVAAIALLAAAGGGWRIWRARAQHTAGVREIRFGIAQYLPADQLRDSYTPLAEYLSERLGRPVRLVIHEDYVDLAQTLAQRDLDLVALSPYAYVRLKRKVPNLHVLATPVTNGGASYEGVILTRGDSGIVSLQDLRGKVFCYTNPSSASGYLYPRALFKRAGIDPDRAFSATRFTGDHLGALRALVAGGCDGAAVYAAILFESKSHGIAPDAFRILASTERIPYDAYCAHPDLSPELTASIEQALLALPPGDKRAASLFARQGAIIGFQKASDSDYDGVRRIERYLDEPARK